MAPILSYFAIAALCTSVLAFPSLANSDGSSNRLARRDNKYKLKCGNAPDHVGGDPLPADQGLVLPDEYPTTGSSKEAFAYMYCTPGTSTYTFFWLPSMDPPPLDYMGMKEAFNRTQKWNADQLDITLSEDSLTVNPLNTNVQIHLENAKKGKFTWGIVNAAMSGLSTWATQYNSGCNGGACNAMVFEVNDGQWGEIGIGYAGLYQETTGNCILEIKGGNDAKYTYCKDLGKLTS